MEREQVRVKLKTDIARFESCIVEIFRAKGAQAFDELEKAIENSSNSNMGAAAIQMLGALRSDSANRILASAVQMDSLRDTASHVLIKNADLRVAPYLAELLPPLTPEHTRRAAVKILEALNWAPQTEEQAICLAIAKRDWNRCIQAGSQAVPWLAQALNHPESSWEDQRSAAETLATIGGQEAIRILDGQLTWPSLARRTAIISALPKLDAQEAINRLLVILTDPQRYPDCRPAAIMSLKQIYLDAPITIREHIRALGRTILRHGDTAAAPHQDTRTPQPGHQDYGGGKCIFPHTDIGSTHQDVHGRVHEDTGLSRDFPL
jgi:HEAT repeat protein